MVNAIVVKKQINCFSISREGAENEEYMLPSTAIFSGLKQSERVISFVSNGILCSFEHGGDDGFTFQLTNVKWLSQKDLERVAIEFSLKLKLVDEKKNYYSAILREGPSPDSILIIRLFVLAGLTHAVVYQLKGSIDADADLPYIWRIAEVELSEEFKKKIGF